LRRWRVREEGILVVVRVGGGDRVGEGFVGANLKNVELYCDGLGFGGFQRSKFGESVAAD